MIPTIRPKRDQTLDQAAKNIKKLMQDILNLLNANPLNNEKKAIISQKFDAIKEIYDKLQQTYKTPEALKQALWGYLDHDPQQYMLDKIQERIKMTIPGFEETKPLAESSPTALDKPPQLLPASTTTTESSEEEFEYRPLPISQDKPVAADAQLPVNLPLQNTALPACALANPDRYLQLPSTSTTTTESPEEESSHQVQESKIIPMNPRFFSYAQTIKRDDKSIPINENDISTYFSREKLSQLCSLMKSNKKLEMLDFLLAENYQQLADLASAAARQGLQENNDQLEAEKVAVPLKF